MTDKKSKGLGLGSCSPTLSQKARKGGAPQLVSSFAEAGPSLRSG